MSYNITVNWDGEAGVWCAISDEIPLALESNSFDALVEKTKHVAREILELNNKLDSAAQLCFNVSHSERIA